MCLVLNCAIPQLDTSQKHILTEKKKTEQIIEIKSFLQSTSHTHTQIRTHTLHKEHRNAKTAL